MNIQHLQDQLRAHIRARITRGELTGSRLAGKAGFPQGHLSNFLNARRNLSLESMDRLLDALGIGIVDLIAGEDLQPHSRPPARLEPFAPVAIVDQKHAAQARFSTAQILGTRNFSRAFLRKLRARVVADRRDWLRFVLLKLDAQRTAGLFPRAAATMLLIDRHYSSLHRYRRVRPNLYVVKIAGRCVAAYVSVCDNCLVLRPRDLQQEVEIIHIQRGRSYTDYIVGRVCHVALEL